MIQETQNNALVMQKIFWYNSCEINRTPIVLAWLIGNLARADCCMQIGPKYLFWKWLVPLSAPSSHPIGQNIRNGETASGCHKRII